MIPANGSDDYEQWDDEDINDDYEGFIDDDDIVDISDKESNEDYEVDEDIKLGPLYPLPSSSDDDDDTLIDDLDGQPMAGDNHD